MKVLDKVRDLNWLLVLLLAVIASIGFAMLYSAANGSFEPWAARQMVRFGIGAVAMLIVALIDIRLWLRYAYLAYFASLALLGSVEVIGTTGMGAQRWIDLGPVNVQPSELMKLTMVLALARYFHGLTLEHIARPTYLVVPLVLVIAPAALVLRQPDLGTAALLVLIGGALFFLAGVRLWKFAVVFVGSLVAVPIAWQFLRDYQKTRILTFLDPESDPLGAGYHILQSKIALGSGGVLGKGFLQGTQSHLNFLPEKQTDFIFTMLAEEFGIAGGFVLVGLYLLVVAYGLSIALRCRHQFGRLLAMGLTMAFFLSVFLNIAMVMGLIPVVGMPLPLISYGGTAMLTTLIGFGLVIGVYIHRDLHIGRRWFVEQG
ncbi:MAG: rod shape-determining protein RodA [Alphaproteobacteria bacterium]